MLNYSVAELRLIGFFFLFSFFYYNFLSLFLSACYQYIGAVNEPKIDLAAPGFLLIFAAEKN